MGVVHSMDETQVTRISRALANSAAAIQGINNKFDIMDGHLTSVTSFNTKLASRVDTALSAFGRLDGSVNTQLESLLENIRDATDQLGAALEGAVEALERVNLQRELDAVPKALIPLILPVLILLIELAISNAYLGILMASIPMIRPRYAAYLIVNAFLLLLGLTLSLAWLVTYRGWLSFRSWTMVGLAAPEDGEKKEGAPNDTLEHTPDSSLSSRRWNRSEDSRRAARPPTSSPRFPSEERREHHVISRSNIGETQDLEAQAPAPEREYKYGAFLQAQQETQSIQSSQSSRHSGASEVRSDGIARVHRRWQEVRRRRGESSERGARRTLKEAQSGPAPDNRQEAKLRHRRAAPSPCGSRVSPQVSFSNEAGIHKAEAAELPSQQLASGSASVSPSLSSGAEPVAISPPVAAPARTRGNTTTRWRMASPWEMSVTWGVPKQPPLAPGPSALQPEGEVRTATTEAGAAKARVEL